jgi:hypothetical protein
MLKNASLTTKQGRSNLLSYYIREARRHGSETIYYELAAQFGVELEAIGRALNLATMGR